MNPANLPVAIGGIFVALAIVFAIVAFWNYFSSQRQWTPAGKTYRRVAMIFAAVGIALWAMRVARG